MRNGLRLGLCVILLALFADKLRADVAPSFRLPWMKKPVPKSPPPPPAFTTEPFVVEFLDDDKEGVQPVLQLTPGFYKSLRKIAMDDVPNDIQKAEAPADEVPPMRWAVAGAAFAIALGMGGLWLRQSGSNIWKMRLALLLGLSAAGTMGGAVVLAARPPEPKAESKAQPPKAPIENQVRVELIDQKNDMVKIRISRKQMEKLLEATKPAPKKEEGPKLPPPPPPPIVFPNGPKI